MSNKMRSPFACPVKCTAGYPNYPSGKYHGGEDYVPVDKGVETNWNLYSPCLGDIYIAKKQSGSYPGGYGAYGNYLVIQNPNGLWVLMAHLKSLPAVKAGTFITTAGVRVGTAGATGNAAGRHLHIEVANMKGVSYNSATWYDKFKAHRVKPSDYIDFSDYEPNEEGFDVKKWSNGSTVERVFQTTTDCKAQKNPIGSLAPHETCDCYGIVDDVYLVAYTVNGTNAVKCGFVKYRGGVR